MQDHTTSMRTDMCGQLTAADAGRTVSVCGWVDRRREHGEHLAFIDLRDRTGVVQCVVNSSHDLRSEYVAKMTGEVRLRPDDTANRDLASAYLQEGKAGLALSYAKRATELDNDSFGAWANLGFVYSRTERFTEAIDAFRSASENASDDDDIQPVLVGLADAHIRLGNYTRATNTLNTIIATNPTSTAHERLGVCLFKQRLYEDALREFKKAVELDGEDTAALNGLGVAYMTLYIEGGRDNTYQRDQAMRAWSKSLDIKPGQRAIIALVSRYSDI